MSLSGCEAWAMWSEPITSESIIVVSGLPRSGTSLMMQMLAAGGIEVVTDGQRKSDDDNPRGYYEDERVKSMGRDNRWLGQARGKAIKVISALLFHLPCRWSYKTILMERDLDEIIRSQNKMLSRSDAYTPDSHAAVMAEKFSTHLDQVRAWLTQQPNLDVVFVPYRAVIEAPETQAHRVQELVRRSLDIDKMVQVVDPTLYRNRGPGA